VCVREVQVLLPSFHDFLCPGLHQRAQTRDNVMSWLTCHVLVGPRPRSSPHSVTHARGRVSTFSRLAVSIALVLPINIHNHPHTRRSPLRPLRETQETALRKQNAFWSYYCTLFDIANSEHSEHSYPCPVLQQPSAVSLSTSSARPPLPASHLS
jgi:hypothetical protein